MLDWVLTMTWQQRFDPPSRKVPNFFYGNVFGTQVRDLERTFSVLLKVPRVDVQMAWFMQGEMEVDTTVSVVEQESTKTREKSQKVEDWQIALRGSGEGRTAEQAIKREESQMTGRGRRGCASHRRSLRWERSTLWFCTAFALSHEFFAPCAAAHESKSWRWKWESFKEVFQKMFRSCLKRLRQKKLAGSNSKRSPKKSIFLPIFWNPIFPWKLCWLSLVWNEAK